MKLELHYEWKLRDKLVMSNVSIPNPKNWTEELNKFMESARQHMDKEGFKMRIELCMD